MLCNPSHHVPVKFTVWLLLFLFYSRMDTWTSLCRIMIFMTYEACLAGTPVSGSPFRSSFHMAHCCYRYITTWLYLILAIVLDICLAQSNWMEEVKLKNETVFCNSAFCASVLIRQTIPMKKLPKLQWYLFTYLILSIC